LTRIADYVVVSSKSINITDGETHEPVTFDISNVATGERSILTLMVEPALGSSGSVQLRIDVNGQAIMTQKFNTEPQRAWQVVVPAQVLREGTNELLASAPSVPDGPDVGFGKVTINDVALFYQANIS
jgi:predicted secreted protein